MALATQTTKLQRETATPGTYEDIAEVLSINGPSYSMDVIDVTHLQSTGSFREFIAGLRDAGEVSFDVNFDPDATTHASLRTDYEAGTKKNYKLVLPDPTPTTFAFAAFITGYVPSYPLGDKMAASLTLKITGKPTIT